MRLKAAPGPDGLIVAFDLATWPWIKNDVHRLITDFYTSGILPTPLKATEAILIPKKRAMSIWSLISNLLGDEQM